LTFDADRLMRRHPSHQVCGGSPGGAFYWPIASELQRLLGNGHQTTLIQTAPRGGLPSLALSMSSVPMLGAGAARSGSRPARSRAETLRSIGGFFPNRFGASCADEGGLKAYSASWRCPARWHRTDVRPRLWRDLQTDCASWPPHPAIGHAGLQLPEALSEGSSTPPPSRLAGTAGLCSDAVCGARAFSLLRLDAPRRCRAQPALGAACGLLRGVVDIGADLPPMRCPLLRCRPAVSGSRCIRHRALLVDSGLPHSRTEACWHGQELFGSRSSTTAGQRRSALVMERPVLPAPVFLVRFWAIFLDRAGILAIRS